MTKYIMQKEGQVFNLLTKDHTNVEKYIIVKLIIFVVVLTNLIVSL